MDDKKDYDKGESAGSKGVEFQVNLLTVFLLRAFQNLQNWRLSTENKAAGKFDDVVLEWSDGSILLQAKHKEKKITLDQLLSTNSKTDDFSLPKYFLSYQEVKDKFKVKNVVLCTNANVDEKALAFLDRHSITPESMLYYKDGCEIYSFNDDILPYLKENAKEYYEKNFQHKNVEVTVITDENLKDFLKHLQFFYNYPSANDLEEIVAELLSTLKSPTKLYGQISPLEIYAKVMDWFQSKHGVYLKEIHVKAMFSEIRTSKYRQVLEQYNVCFQRNVDFQEPKRIFHIAPEGGYLLHLIKIYRGLQNNKNILFVNPDDDISVQKQAIEAFQLPRYTFLIIVCPKVIKESVIQDTCDKLWEILEKYKHKKVILVGARHSKLAQQLGLDNNTYEVVRANITLEDFSEETRESLKKNTNIVFQGSHVSLKELFAAQMSKDYEKSVSIDILEKLVRKEEIRVGSEVPYLDALIARCYVKRGFWKQGQDGMRDETRSEEDIFEVNEKVVLISDSAGMGKSTVLSKLATDIKERNPSLWVITIELNDYCKLFNELKRQRKRTVNVTELLNSKDVTKLTNKLEELVFSMRGNVVLMLDGVDEISPDYTDLIVRLLVQCQEEYNFAKVFVSTRPHMALTLEAKLQVKPFTLQPFTEQNQIDFLTSYWTHNLKLDEADREKCEWYAKLLIQKMLSWTKACPPLNNDFAAIPLHVRMLAEIFEENNRMQESTDWAGCKQYLSSEEEPKLPEKFNITNLYEMFIQKKRDVFLDKGNPSGNTAANLSLLQQFTDCLVNYRIIALELILPNREHELFLSYGKVDKNLESSMLKIGIVQLSKNTIHFIHRTYAEYFVAQTLLSELQLQNPNAAFQRFFIEEILQKHEYRVVRAFLDSLLQEVVGGLPSDTFKNYQSMTYKPTNSFIITHILAREGCIAILELLFKCINFKIVKDKEITVDNFNKKNSGNTLNFLDFLVQQGGVNLKNRSGKTPLHLAAGQGLLEMVKFLVKHGANINSRSIELRTPLHEALIGNHFDTAKFLVEQGADIEAEDSLGHTVMYLAATRNHTRIATLFVETSLSRDGLDTNNLRFSYLAAYLGRLDILKILIEQGVAVDSAIERGELLFFGAARGGQLDIIKYLVQQGADIKARDHYFNTPLHIISKNPSLISTAKLLVELGVEVNVANNLGETALHVAAQRGTSNIVELLVESGGAVNCTNDGDKTPLGLAAVMNHEDTARYLLNVGTPTQRNINRKDRKGLTILHLVARQGASNMVRLLAQCGADINIADNEGFTPLHYVVLWSQRHMIEVLLKLGIDVNIKDKAGRTALHLAALKRQRMLQSFVEHGIDINIKDSDGYTILHLAVLNGDLDAVKFLVQLGADVDIKDSDGFTAAGLAIFEGEKEIFKFLTQHGAKDYTERSKGI